MIKDASEEQIRERQKLVSDHFAYVQSMARRMKGRLKSARLDDLIADGLYGLTLAGQGYDPTRGVSFAAYARKFIMGGMLAPFRKELRDRERRGEGDIELDANTPRDRAIAPEDQAAQNELVEFVRAHIGAGPGKQTDGSLKLETLSRRLGVSRMTAHARLVRARELIKEIEEMRANPAAYN